MPKISVIIPTYNAEKFLDRTIESVLAQTFKDWELIIVDDFSKDNTREIIKKWEKIDERISSIFLDKNSGGPAHPKNIGMEKVKGEYVAFLDHDDEWLPEKLEKQISILEKDPSIGLITCGGFVLNDDNGKLIGKLTLDNIPSEGIFPSIFFKNFMFSNTSLIIPKSVINKLGPRDEELSVADDSEYYFRIASAGYKFYIIHEPLFIYHIYQSSTSKRSLTSIYYGLVALKYLPLYKKYDLEYLPFQMLATAYLRNSDVINAKKYSKIVLSKKPFDINSIFIIIFSLFGKYGSNLFKWSLLMRNDILYLLGKRSKIQRDMYVIN